MGWRQLVLEIPRCNTPSGDKRIGAIVFCMTGLETAGAISSIVIAVVTTATLIVLIWYTVETHKLRVEAQRQNEHSIMPIVMLQSVFVQGQHVGISRPAIRNLGSGPAFNVYVGPMQIS